MRSLCACSERVNGETTSRRAPITACSARCERPRRAVRCERILSENMQMRPPFLSLDAMPGTDIASRPTALDRVHHSDFDIPSLPNYFHLRAIKTHAAPPHVISHPTSPYHRPLPPAPSDDAFTRISLYQPHLTLALPSSTPPTSTSRPSITVPLPCSFAFLSSFAAESTDPYIFSFFQPAISAQAAASHCGET